LLETEKEVGLGGIHHCACRGGLAVFIGEVETTGRVEGGRERQGGGEKESFVEVEPPNVSVFLVGGKDDLGEGGGEKQPKRTLFCIVEEAEGPPAAAFLKRKMLHLVKENKMEEGRKG